LIVGDALSARLFLSGSSREVAGPSEAGQWRGKPRKQPPSYDWHSGFRSQQL